MSRVPKTIELISQSIQSAFGELVKLLIGKTLRPTLNPLGSNVRTIYNTSCGKNGRTLIGSNPVDNMNKYNYKMTHDSLGWTGDNLANFKVMAKFIKNNAVQRFPSGYSKIRNTLLSKSPVAFSDKEVRDNNPNICTTSQYKNFLSFLFTKSMTQVIYNRKGSFAYTSDIPYKYSFKQLENIGQDIINNLNSHLKNGFTKVSTGILHIKLSRLDRDLANFSIDNPDIFCSYIEMVRLINSVQRDKMVWIINLIATLSFHLWDDLKPEQKNSYYNALGKNFIEKFNNNKLIKILLKNDSKLILTSSYMYPLLKMLFIVFGYSRLVPCVVDRCTEPLDDINVDSECQEKLERFSNKEGLFHKHSFSEPHDFIRRFGELYPTIVGLMGGTEEFPPDDIVVECESIPPNYNDLETLSEYLWRFNDYSYCRYLEYIRSKERTVSLAAKVNVKTRDLKNA
ncbi:MAG: hypothetical protein QXW79_00670 [Thermoplasmata archaeon]